MYRAGRRKEPPQPAKAQSELRERNADIWRSARLSVLDRIDEGEQRWQTVGLAGGTLVLVVAHRYREGSGGRTHI